MGYVATGALTRIEVRAKLPDGRGTWPAFWMLGDDFPDVGWPTSGFPFAISLARAR